MYLNTSFYLAIFTGSNLLGMQAKRYKTWWKHKEINKKFGGIKENVFLCSVKHQF